MEHNYLPTGPGALAEAAPIVSPNAVYATKARLIFYDDPVFGAYQPSFDRIFAEPRYTDLDANLTYFATLYAKIAAGRRPVETYAGDFSAEDFPDFKAFYTRYYAYIDAEAGKVAAALAKLADHS
jgi:hypothetical protein